jgi:hypothetical protein
MCVLSDRSDSPSLSLEERIGSGRRSGAVLTAKNSFGRLIPVFNAEHCEGLFRQALPNGGRPERARDLQSAEKIFAGQVDHERISVRYGGKARYSSAPT